MLREKKTIVVAGCGEIGKPIYQLCCSGYEQVIVEDPRYGKPEKPLYPVAALHVAIPGSIESFVQIITDYYKKYKPGIILIHSSTAPGTTKQVENAVGVDNIAHTQVHGKHHGNKMRSDMLHYPKFVATSSGIAFDKAKEILEQMGHPAKKILHLTDSFVGELSKLLATTFFGYMIVWTQEIERMSKQFNVDYDELMSFTKLLTDDFNISQIYPGVIGGHCVMQNIEILNNVYPTMLWDYMMQSNDKKREDQS